jgi:hypothetical protein
MELLEWLCPDDINPHRDQATYLNLRTDGTAQWMFDHSLYKQWLERVPPFLWISGKCTCLENR